MIVFFFFISELLLRQQQLASLLYNSLDFFFFFLRVHSSSGDPASVTPPHGTTGGAKNKYKKQLHRKEELDPYRDLRLLFIGGLSLPQSGSSSSRGSETQVIRSPGLRVTRSSQIWGV